MIPNETITDQDSSKARTLSKVLDYLMIPFDIDC